MPNPGCIKSGLAATSPECYQYCTNPVSSHDPDRELCAVHLELHIDNLTDEWASAYKAIYRYADSTLTVSNLMQRFWERIAATGS